MSAPFENYEDPLRGAVLEVISAMSALNMEPSPTGEKGDYGYLSETDEWAKHAMVHLRSAVNCIREADAIRPHSVKVPAYWLTEKAQARLKEMRAEQKRGTPQTHIVMETDHGLERMHCVIRDIEAVAKANDFMKDMTAGEVVLNFIKSLREAARGAP